MAIVEEIPQSEQSMASTEPTTTEPSLVVVDADDNNDAGSDATTPPVGASILIKSSSIPGTPEGEVVHSAKKVTIVAPDPIGKEEKESTTPIASGSSRAGSPAPEAGETALTVEVDGENAEEGDEDEDEDEDEEDAGGEDDDAEDHANDPEDELEEAYFWHEQIIGELQRVCRDSDPRGAYAIIAPLSTDKLGRVSYTARADRTGEVVVVKTTILEEPIERFAGKRLITELFLVRDMLAHPNVIGFYDLYLVETSEVWLVTEYMKEGVTLGDVIAGTKGEFTEERMARICLEACKGLAHLHSQLIIHRDIRSDSIIIDPRGRVKITGFAFSVQLPDKAAKRRTMVSTLALPNARAYTVDKTHWTAPEIIKRREYGPEIDVWAFGITLFEMLEGGPPYKGEEPLKVLFLILVNGAPELKEAERWSEELKDFLSDCLTVDTEVRPGMGELVEHAFLKKACAPAELAPLLEMKPETDAADDAVDAAAASEDADPADGTPAVEATAEPTDSSPAAADPAPTAPTDPASAAAIDPASTATGSAPVTTDSVPTATDPAPPATPTTPPSTDSTPTSANPAPTAATDPAPVAAALVPADTPAPSIAPTSTTDTPAPATVDAKPTPIPLIPTTLPIASPTPDPAPAPASAPTNVDVDPAPVSEATKAEEGA
ncbi:kinase-like domain-containing protein [Mycena filopes]|nr:kinase-like domain-containing protein [Mycena filopes]